MQIRHHPHLGKVTAQEYEFPGSGCRQGKADLSGHGDVAHIPPLVREIDQQGRNGAVTELYDLQVVAIRRLRQAETELAGTIEVEGPRISHQQLMHRHSIGRDSAAIGDDDLVSCLSDKRTGECTAQHLTIKVVHRLLEYLGAVDGYLHRSGIIGIP